MIAPLHVHSGYSLLRGPTGLEGLIRSAARLGCAQMAVTDVNALYGATNFCLRAQEAGIQPIVGAELRDGPHAAVALVAQDAGYENLCRILTRIHCGAAPADRSDAPAPPADAAWAPGIRVPVPEAWRGFTLARGLGEFSAGLHVIVEDAALAESLSAAGVPRDRLWLGLDPATQSEAQVRALAAAAERLGLPLTATGKAMFAEEGDFEIARLLAAMRTGTTFDSVDASELSHPCAFFRAEDRLRRELAHFPQALAGNRRLAEECAAYCLLPRRPVFPAFACPNSLRASAYLRGLCFAGMDHRYGRIWPKAVARMDRELKLIEQMGFSEYFLVVWDIVQYARRRGAPVAGRGSGASSIVAYLLGITNVCPIAFDIPFERFLHEGRKDFPDLDVDFCWRIRDDVLAYAFGRWGADRVAMVSMHSTFQAASALRQTAKAFGLSDEQISRLDEADLAAGGVMGRIVSLSRRILGLPTHLAVHPGGIVIGRKTMDHYVPIEPAAKGVLMAQYDKHGVEDIGLVKLDLLGNRSLSTIRYACDLIERRTGERIDTESLPPADPDTVRTLQSADTVACNQLESPAMRHLLRALQPRGVREVMKALALIRPGAASIGMKEAFIRRQRGLDRVPHGHPKVDEILHHTGGVMLYEDDVMLVAAALSGGSLAEGDRFRKAVQKCRDDDHRLKLSREFLARCRAQGVDEAYARDLWVQMAKFNAYSFCRAHAASYAMLAYTVAWLKTHHPLEFYAAALNNNQSMYHPRVYVEQAKRRGVRFLLPDVNRSAAEFAPEGEAVRVGLGCVGGLGPVGAATILQARQADGPFAGLGEFLSRTRLGREEARTLVLCGAFDFTSRARPALMMGLELVLAARTRLPAGRGALLTAEPDVPENTGDYPHARKYTDERRILGFSVREHILAVFRERLAGLTDADSRDLPRRIGRKVRIAGVLEAHRTTPTQRNQTMRFLTLDDEYGLFEATVFPGVSRGLDGSLDKYGPYVIEGKVEEQYDAITVTADRVTLPAAREPQPAAV